MFLKHIEDDEGELRVVYRALQSGGLETRVRLPRGKNIILVGEKK